MKPHITEAMVNARVADQLEAQARRGVSLPIELVRGLARTHLVMTARNIPDPAPAKASAPEPSKAPQVAVPPRRVVPPIPAAVLADRERAVALLAMTAKGAQAEAECREAIRTGATPEQYASTVAARSILDARRATRVR